MGKEQGASDKSDRAVVNGAASVSAVPASVPSALRYATVAEERRNILRSIISALAEHPERAQIVVQMPARQAVKPREVWIEDLAAWVRLDGHWVSLDLGRGAFEPTVNEAACIRLAAEHWEAAQAIEARRAETGTGSVHESAVPNGDAPGKGQP